MLFLAILGTLSAFAIGILFVLAGIVILWLTTINGGKESGQAWLILGFGALNIWLGTQISPFDISLNYVP